MILKSRKTGIIQLQEFVHAFTTVYDLIDLNGSYIYFLKNKNGLQLIVKQNKSSVGKEQAWQDHNNKTIQDFLEKPN